MAQPDCSKTTIVFIEDEEPHWDAIRKWLPKDRYECVRIPPSELDWVRSIAEKTQPALAVVDIMLPEASAGEYDQQISQAADKRSSPAKRDAVKRSQPPGTHDPIQEPGWLGLDFVEELRSVCPNIRLLLCSQLGSQQQLDAQAKFGSFADAVSKQLGPNRELTNAREIADRIRGLL